MRAGNDRPSVIVVGGGYAGVEVALALDERLDVTVVDPKDTFVHCVAALRALVDEEWLPRIFLPYANLLTHGRVVRDRAVRVAPGEVALESGATLSADFVVLATGSRYPFPAKSDVDDAATALDRYRAARAALGDAHDVLIVGGGPVGIELAGEIVTAMPDKHVTILEMADDVLGPRFGPKVKVELRRQLAELGVDVVLGSPLKALPPTEPGALGRFRVVTERGDELSADIWFRCWGVTPSSDCLTGALGDVRDAAGFVAVNEHLQVAGQTHVFAVGDVTAGDAKMAAVASRHAKVAAANILALIDGAPLTAYAMSGPGIAVPIGPHGGAGQFGDQELVGAEVVSRLKGVHLGMARMTERFRVEVSSDGPAVTAP